MEMRPCQSRAAVTANKSSSITDRGQVTGKLSQGQGELEMGVLKGKLQRAAHARAAEAVGLCWPAHRNRTATALLAAGMGKDLVLSRQEDQ